VPFGLRNYWSGRFLGELPDELIDMSAARMQPDDVYGSVMIEPIFGAASRVPSEATAFAGRGAAFNATYINIWTDAAEDEAQVATARDFTASLAPWAIGGGYVNYASESVGDGLLTEYGDERLERLRRVKRQYDPDNRFRFNHNISPD
jgi:FAD/FMN-containing dehydrogenase